MTEKKEVKKTQLKKKANRKKSPNLSVTNVEKERRVMECVQLMGQGFSRPEIIQYFSDKYNKLTDRTADNYIQLAREKIKENFAIMFDKEYFKANIFKRLEDLYKQSYDIDDYKECRVILKDLRDMLGLNDPTKQDITTDGKEINSIPQIIFTSSKKN